MDKLSTEIKNYTQSISGGPKNRQGRAFVRVLQFFAIMIALSIFARGAAGITMPLVKVSGLTTQNIRSTDEFHGTMAAANKEKIKLPAEMKIEEIDATPGTTVEVGDTLITLSTAEMDKNLSTQEISLQEMEIKLAELQKPMKQDSSGLESAKKAQEAAQKSYDKTASGGIVRDAEAELEKARTDYENAKTDVAKYKKEMADVKKDHPEDSAKFEAAKAKYDAAVIRKNTCEERIETAKQAVETAKKQSAEDIEAAKSTLDDANTALDEAQKAFNEETPSFNLESKKRKLEIDKAVQEIGEQKKMVERLRELATNKGKITATVAGTVVEITPQSGATTTEQDYISISTGSSGYIAEFSVSQDKARAIKMGSIVNITMGDYYWGAEGRVVGKGVPDESGNVMMRASVTGADFQDGDQVNVNLVYSDKQYWTCVPIGAVRPESGGYYVLVLQDRNTILGTQTVARKQTVTIMDKDKNYAAIEGIYEQNARIVVSAGKPVNDGDMVRIDDEGAKNDTSSSEN